MTCQRCGKAEARVTTVIIVATPHTFHHLCPACVEWARRESEERILLRGAGGGR
jgi:protein-arginine kinase activator protein McsA